MRAEQDDFVGLELPRDSGAYLRIAAIGTWSPRYHRSGFTIGFAWSFCFMP